MITIFQNKVRQILPLVIILLLGFYFRVSGIGFGLPELLHPDEARIILDSMSMGQRMSLIPQDINYPLFHKYILLLSYGVYYLFGLLFGFFKNQTDFAVSFLVNPSSIVFFSRVIISIIGTITVLIAYLWGKHIGKSSSVGFLAGLFIACEWQLLIESQFALHQSLAALTSLLAFFGLCLICSYQNRRAYVLGGLTFGLAIASHQTAILFLPGILFIFLTDIFQKQADKKIVIKQWILFGLIATAVGVLGNLHWIFQFSRSLRFFLHGSEAGKIGFSSTPYFTYNLPSTIFWYYFELIKRNYFLGVVSALSAITAIIRRNKIDILYLIISLTYFLFFYHWTLRWMHLFVGLIPVSMVYGAITFYAILKKINIYKPILIILISLIIIIPNIIDIFKVSKLKKLPETRQTAKRWIENNIPNNSVIAVDWPALAVPVSSTSPAILRNRVAQDYFLNQVPEIIRDEFDNTMKNSNTYFVVDMIETKVEPVRPDEMPIEAVDKASRSISLQDTYSYFNFIPLEQLKQMGVEYIVITSYTYGMALVNDDPRKEFLINYYLKDNTVPFYSNTDVIYPNSQHELIFYAVKRMRDYFLQLLDGKIEGIKLIKEIYPENNLGPVVKIYQVSQELN